MLNKAMGRRVLRVPRPSSSKTIGLATMVPCVPIVLFDACMCVVYIYLKNLVVRVLGLFLNVSHDGPNGLDDGDDQRAEGSRTGVIKD